MNNKATLEKANAAITMGDYEAFLELCTDDTEWTFVGDKTLRGKAAVREWMKIAYTEPPNFKVAKLIAGEDFVTALGEITIKDQNGHPVIHSYCDVWRFREGRMAALTAFVIKV